MTTVMGFLESVTAAVLSAVVVSLCVRCM